MTLESGAAVGAGRAIFISYRRDDSEGEAGRLFDDLVRAYGDTNVFMDVAGIEPGVDFRQAIDKNVSGCGVLLAMIGPTWATLTGRDGTRRLDNPEDYVRLEISTALKRGIPVIPVLVHDAKMPALDQLPEDLKDLRYRNSVELTHARWNSDVTLLVGALKAYVHVDSAHEADTVHAQVPVQLPAPLAAPAEAPQGKSKLPLMIGIAVAVLAAIGIGIAMLMHKPTPVPAPDPIAAFLGDWQNVQMPATGDNLIRLQVTQETPESGGKYVVHAWGRCQPSFCDWGEHHANLNGDELVTVSFDLRNTPEENTQLRSSVIRLRPSGQGLSVTVSNKWQAKGQEQAQQDQSDQDSKVREKHLEFSKGFR